MRLGPTRSYLQEFQANRGFYSDAVYYNTKQSTRDSIDCKKSPAHVTTMRRRRICSEPSHWVIRAKRLQSCAQPRFTSTPSQSPSRTVQIGNIYSRATMSTHSDPSSDPSTTAELQRISRTLRTTEADDPAVSPIRRRIPSLV